MISIFYRLVLFFIVATTSSSCGYNKIESFENNVNITWDEVEDVYLSRNHFVDSLLLFLRNDSLTLIINNDLLQQMNTETKRQLMVLDITSTQSINRFATYQSTFGHLLENTFNEVNKRKEENEGWQDFERQYEKNQTQIITAQANYNSNVKAYNSFLRKFPPVLYAQLAGYSVRPYLQNHKNLEIITATEGEI